MSHDGDEDYPLQLVAPWNRLRERPGDSVPFDGTVLSSESAGDQSMITGDPMHVTKTRAAASGGCFARSAVIMLAVDGLMLGEVWRLTPFTGEQRELIVRELLRLADEACPELSPR